MNPVIGQYECVHSSGVGLDYFTSRIDRLMLYPNGCFTLILQKRSRATHAAHSLMSGEQVTTVAPETRLEGEYTCQDDLVSLHFAHGGWEKAQLSSKGDGLQMGPNFFTKVSDSTLLPPTHRLKQDMQDIAKGMKIASTIGSMAVKAAKTIHETIQPTQGSPSGHTAPQSDATVRSTDVSASAPAQPQAPAVHHPMSPPRPASTNPEQPSTTGTSASHAGWFCDQCGARGHPGKHFCNQCGARLT